jgi:Flp pilus assembly protein TadD
MAQAHNNLGEVLASQGKLEEAIDRFRQAIRLDPASAEPHNNLGASLGLQGRLDQAIAEFREALRIDPGHVRAGENLRTAMERAAAR